MMKKFAKGILAVSVLSTIVSATTFANGGDILPDSDTKAIKESTLSNLSDWELRAARYEISARHGKEVYSEDMKDYFEGKSWYHPDEDFDSSMLSETEKDNIELLYDCELERKQEAAEEQFQINQEISLNSDVQVMSSSFVYMDSPLYYEDFVGTWVDERDEDYPYVLEVWEENGSFYYEYYSIAPGNSSGVGFANTYTKWGRWHGAVVLDTQTGFITCYDGDDPTTDTMFKNFAYDVMSDTIVEASTSEYRNVYEKNDDYEYEL